MDHMEASCVFYVKVGRFDHLEQSKICVLTVSSFGIVLLTVHHNMIVRVWFMWDPGDVLRQTSPDVLFVKECPFYIYQRSDFSHSSPQYIHVNKQATSDWLTANRGTMGIPSNLVLYAAGFSLNRTCKLAVTESILSCRDLYIPQDFPLLFVIIFLTFSQRQIMAPQAPQLCAIGFESSRMTGALSNAPPAETQLQYRHQLVRRDTAIAATKNMTQYARLKTVRETEQSKNMKQHAIGCE